MAAHHTRSNSFPSKQHPLVPEFDEQLCRLRSSDEAASSLTLLSGKLSGLEDLHDCVDRLLLLPLNQQALPKQQNEKCVDELLDGSLRILDMCNTAKDALLQLKESTREIQSIMRRRRGDESSLSCEVKKFLNSRKVVKKALRKAMENKCSFSLLNKDQEIVTMLREAQSITLSVFESVLSFISGPKSSSWSLVSKLMNSKKVSCDEEVNKSNEFTSADAALTLLMSHKMKKNSDSTLEENAQNELQKLEACIQDLEEGIESLYRRLIKTRVSLLNILNH